MIDILFFTLAATPALLSTLGTAIGQSLIGQQALQSIHKQPSAAQNISRLSVIATAVTETAAVIGLVVSLMLITESEHLMQQPFHWYGLAGIASAVGISGLCAGLASSFSAVASCQSLARQPFLQTKILNLMLITQTLIMTPNMFGMMVALLIKNKVYQVETFGHAMQLLAAGLAIGLGCIGPCIGLAIFAYQACAGIGINKKGYTKILTFTFIGEAIIETPIIFSLLISLLILNSSILPASLVQPWQFLAAALCIGLSTISPGINLGKTGAQACYQIAHQDQQYANISKIAMFGMAMIDTFTIYGFLLAVIMLLM
jgi:F-type H+-transporting ATPase subunit c